MQERWFARLYWLKPLAIVSLAAFWIATGVIALGPGRATALSYFTKAGFGASAAELLLVLGSLVDIVLGMAVCVRRFARRALQLMLIVSGIYLWPERSRRPSSGSIRSGPILKIIPVMLATVFTLAILDDR